MPGPNAFMQRLLRDAGISPGMRVLDLGCGNGEVTFLAAQRTGDGGAVVGIDRDEKAIEAARARAEESGCTAVSFAVRDLSEPLSAMGAFDAVVGRRVLMYLKDPLSVLREVFGLLRPGGLCVFQESDSTMAPGRLTPLPLHDRVIEWIWKTVEREGADIHMGFHLPAFLSQAGFTVDRVEAEPAIQGRESHHPLALIIKAMLPRITAHGVATEAEIEIHTLEERLNAERPADTVYISDMAFGVRGRKSG